MTSLKLDEDNVCVKRVEMACNGCEMSPNQGGNLDFLEFKRSKTTTFKFKWVVYVTLNGHYGPIKLYHVDIDLSKMRQPERYRLHQPQCGRYRSKPPEPPHHGPGEGWGGIKVKCLFGGVLVAKFAGRSRADWACWPGQYGAWAKRQARGETQQVTESYRVAWRYMEQHMWSIDGRRRDWVKVQISDEKKWPRVSAQAGLGLARRIREDGPGKLRRGRATPS
jgi:hypothetical protein